MLVAVVQHEFVLVVGGDAVWGYGGFGDSVAGVDARVVGSAFRSCPDGGGGGPDKGCAGGVGTELLDEGWEGCLVLGFGVVPAVHSIVEVDDAEGYGFHLDELGDLVREAWVAYGGGGGEEVDVRFACESGDDAGKVGARDGVAEEEDVGELRVWLRGADLPGPLDFFGDGDWGLRDKWQGEEGAGREEEECVACCPDFLVRVRFSLHNGLSIFLARSGFLG